MEDKLKYAAITKQIIGCAMRVHAQMKNGHREIVYQRCLAIEMTKAGLQFKAEADMAIYYDNLIVGRRRIDFFVANVISVEIKTHVDITNADLAQAINNLESHRLEVGLLINFGAPSLQFRRLYNNKLASKTR